MNGVSSSTRPACRVTSFTSETTLFKSTPSFMVELVERLYDRAFDSVLWMALVSVPVAGNARSFNSSTGAPPLKPLRTARSSSRNGRHTEALVGVVI